MQSSTMRGKIYLMEVASTEAGQLTPEAHHILRTSEVVLHDDQVSPALLDLTSASAQVRNVHKLDTQMGSLREKIHTFLVSAAKHGHQVLWLNAEEINSSRRAEEEISALAQEEIDFEIVSTGPLAAGASAGTRSR